MEGLLSLTAGLAVPRVEAGFAGAAKLGNTAALVSVPDVSSRGAVSSSSSQPASSSLPRGVEALMLPAV